MRRDEQSVDVGGKRREKLKAHGLKLRNTQRYHFRGQLTFGLQGFGAVVSVYVQTGDRYVEGGVEGGCCT